MRHKYHRHCYELSRRDKAEDVCNCDAYPLKNAPESCPLEANCCSSKEVQQQSCSSDQSRVAARGTSSDADDHRLQGNNIAEKSPPMQQPVQSAMIGDRKKVIKQMKLEANFATSCRDSTTLTTTTTTMADDSVADLSNQSRAAEVRQSQSSLYEDDPSSKTFTDLDAGEDILIRRDKELNGARERPESPFSGRESQSPPPIESARLARSRAVSVKQEIPSEASPEHNIRTKKLKSTMKHSRKKTSKKGAKTKKKSNENCKRNDVIISDNTADLLGFCSSDDGCCSSPDIDIGIDSSHLLYNSTNSSDNSEFPIREQLERVAGSESLDEAIQSDRHNPLLQFNQPNCQLTKLTGQQQEQLGNLIKIIRSGNFDEFVDMFENQDFKRNLLNVFVNGQTALHYALLYGRSVAWCRRLVLSGSNPNLTNRAGWHPVHLAAYSCSVETMRYLLDCLDSQ